MIRSAFIYGHRVESNTRNFYFDEENGNGVITFSVDSKGWSMERLRLKIQESLNNLGTYNYSVTVNPSTRVFTISADNNFSLLPSQSTTGSLFDVIGFVGDKTGANSYTGDNATGSIYYPQFPLEEVILFEDDKRPVSASKSEAPGGEIRGTAFGLKGHMTCDFKFIGDITHSKESPVESNPNGLQDARDFLDYCITFGEIDFFYDRNNLSSFTSCVQISNGRNRDGQGYQLKDIRNLYGFKELKNIVFREL